MLRLNLDRIFKVKGISKTNQYLIKLGNSDGYASQLVHGRSVSIRFDKLEILCKALNCTPNDLFDYKDDAKALGAKWDMSCKKWYYENNLSDANKIAILEIEKKSESDVEVHTKEYVKIPFSRKKEAQNLGCRWDSEKKSWYYMSNLDKKKIDGIKKIEAA